MFICGLCGSAYQSLEHLDHSEEGFFCDVCDSFTYFESAKEQHRLTLFLEKNGSPGCAKHNQINFNKRLSPLRYPGGKSKLLPLIYNHLQNRNTQCFVEPFAGGAGVGLGLLDAKIINHYVLNDKDYGIYALFQTIKSNPEKLIQKLRTITPTHKDFFQAKSIIQNDYFGCSITEAAWALLITNRLSFSGIHKANPLGGKNGTGHQLLSRWNPAALITRIQKIHELSKNITVTNQDALEVIEYYYWEPNTTLFIDPPYFKQGKKLYTHYYDEHQHVELEKMLFSLHLGCPGADVLLTYDNEPFVQNLYWWADSKTVQQHYSI